MDIILKFDYYSRTLYIPDGYIEHLNKIYEQFFEWLFEQPECLVELPKNLGLRYDENDFLRYINEVILLNSNEKAYLVSGEPKNKKKAPVLKF